MIRLLGILVLPGLYIIAVNMFALNWFDKVIVFLLTLMSIGLLFPQTQKWVEKFAEKFLKVFTARKKGDSLKGANTPRL